MSIQKIIQESINNKPLEMKEAFAEELRNRIAEALATKMEEVELDEALKIGSKVRIHAPGKDYHGKIGHVGEIRKRTYGTMAPSYTVDYREPGDEYNRSISLSREKIKLHREEVELCESSGVHDIKSLQKHFEGPTAYDAAAHSPAMMRRKGLDGKKYDLIKVGNGKYRAELSEEADLEEAVEVRHDRYMRSHGKKARDAGHPSTWMFTHKDMGDVDYNDEKQVHTARGKFADAKKSAQEWAKKHGHRTVYVMESLEQIDELDRKTLHSYLTKSSSDLKAINTARKITANDKSPEEDVKHHADLTRKAGNRKKGFSRAYDRLAKE